MIQLLKKEMKLTASVLSYLFVAFALMTLIPQYPILVGAFFACFGIFQTFQRAREANDTLYTTLLPVKKADIVSAKFLFTVVIQMCAFALTILLVFLRLLVLNKVEPYSINSMMNANLAFLGYVLLIYSWFNIFFVGGFFKTAYKIGVPFLKFAIAAFVTITVGEALHFFPNLDVLNSSDFHWSQLAVFGIGASVYVAGTVLSLKISQKNFEKIDL